MTNDCTQNDQREHAEKTAASDNMWHILTQHPNNHDRFIASRNRRHPGHAILPPVYGRTQVVPRIDCASHRNSIAIPGLRDCVRDEIVSEIVKRRRSAHSRYRNDVAPPPQ